MQTSRPPSVPPQMSAAMSAAVPPYLPSALPREIPPELDRWNWGAFLLHWIWGLGNSTPIALLTWVPGIGILVMPFVLGAKGSAWAWRNARWDSAEHFRKVQRWWAIAGIVVWTVLICVVGAAFGGIVYVLMSSEAYRLATERLESSPQAQSILGSPVSSGWPMGSIQIADQSGAAALQFSASGPKARGSVTVRAVRANGTWRLIKLQLTPEGQQPIELAEERRASLD